MLLRTLKLMGVVLIALVMGVFWGTWFTLTRSIETFSPECFLAIGRTIIWNVSVPMRILIPFTIVILMLVCWFAWSREKGSFYLYLLSLLLIITTLIITLSIEAPIDNKIRHWRVDELPQDWELLRSKWHKFHMIRTCTSLAALFVFALGMVKRRIIKKSIHARPELP